MVHKNIFLSNCFIFDQRGPIFTLAVVAVFPKQVLLCQSTQKPGAQKQPPKDMRIRIPKFFSVLKNWRSNFFIFTPKRSYEVEILNMAEKVLQSGMVLYTTFFTYVIPGFRWKSKRYEGREGAWFNYEKLIKLECSMFEFLFFYFCCYPLFSRLT